jgi:basic membrane protein A
MKKFIALLAVLAMVFALVACAAPTSETKGVKIGVILVHDENTGYDAAHIEGIKAGAEAAGISADDIVWKYNIPEDETCYDTAIDLVEQVAPTSSPTATAISPICSRLRPRTRMSRLFP